MFFSQLSNIIPPSLFANNIYVELIGSLTSLLIFFILYSFIKYGIGKQQEWNNEKKRLYVVRVRNSFFIFYFIFLLFLWGGELKTLLFSAAALFAAFFITFKEAWLSVLGYFISNKSFPLNDFIDYDGITGKIIDRTFLYTKVAIYGNHNSKILVFPNMIYLTSKINNISKLGKYQSFKLSICNPDLKTLHKNSEFALTVAKNVIQKHLIGYEEYFKEKKENHLIFDIPSTEPVLTYNLSDQKNITFHINYIAHPSDRLAIENEIQSVYLQYIQDSDYKYINQSE